MDTSDQDLLKPESVPEGEDVAASIPEELSEEEQEHLRKELEKNISKGLQDVASTNVYKKTSETLFQAGQKASSAFSTVGSVITSKLEDVKNSPTFKSFEEKVETLKTKVGGSRPATGDFGEVLNSTANASATDSLTENDLETQ
ncbi:Hypothetical predicted protein [Pelobates cultripes]|uniref:Tumor protein D52 n=1 Tax=Pelobates cultripes TaxID=61616 RepID=A0AAD1R2R1_PELCU|nr:Hypothetical predicted protein [Pelobates cultripes]